MSGADNIDIIRGAYAAFGRGDLDAILDALADDIDWAADTSSDGAPWYGIRMGRDAVGEFFEDIGKAIEIDDDTRVSMI